MIVAGGSADLVSSWGASSLALALLVVAIAFNVTNQRIQRRDIRDLRRENAVCNYRTWMLVGVLDANGIKVASNFYEVPPEEVINMTATEQQREAYHRGRFDLFRHEEGAIEWRFVAGFVALVLVAFVVIGGVLNHFVVEPLHDVQSTQRAQQRSQRDDDKILAGLAEANRQAKCTNVATSKAIGALLYGLADNFATAPWPDPDRQRAVGVLRALGDEFSAAKPVPCPSTEGATP